MEKVNVRPARHYRESPELATTVRGVHGYQASCTCGWRGVVREKHGVAAYDAWGHRCNAHPLPWEVVGDTPPSTATS